jgi:hypothetical protein
MSKIRIKQTKPKKAKPKETVEHAVATSKKPYDTDEEKISCERSHMEALKGCSHWAAATDVQSAANAWDATTTAMETNNSAIGKLRSDLSAAVTLQVSLRNKWTAGRKHTISAVNAFGGGDATILTDMGFDLLTHTSAGLEIGTPTGIVTSPGESQGEINLAWELGGNRHGFMVQHTTNPADPTTFSTPIPCTTPDFTLDGLVSGAVVHFRIASIDPSVKGHLTDWSPWVAGSAK